MENKNQHKSLTIIFKDLELDPLRYFDAELHIDEVSKTYVIDAIIQLPLNEPDPDDETSEVQYGYFKIRERVDIESVLRIYTLDESK